MAHLSLSLIAMSAFAIQAEAQPTSANGTVVSGTATIVDTNATTTINQTSDVAHFDWDNFDIATGQTVQFNVPRAASLSVNRVTSGIASTIAGNLSSNGQVFLINEHGLTFNNGVNVNVPTFVASTIDTFNNQADANQYAEIKFNKFGDFGTVNRMIAIAPSITFESAVSTKLDLSNVSIKQIYAANTAHLKVNLANYISEVELPDAQADIAVPAGKKLGIFTVIGENCFWGCSYGQMDLSGRHIEMIAKSVSIQDNISSIIQLGDESISRSGFGSTIQISQKSTNVNTTAIHIESAGRIYTGGQVVYSTLDKDASYAGNNYSVKFIAGTTFDANLYNYDGKIIAGDLYVEADNISFAIDRDGARYIYGKRTFVQRVGALTVKNDRGFGALNAGEIDHDFLKPLSNSLNYVAPVELRAETINIEDDINYVGKLNVNQGRANDYTYRVCSFGCFNLPVMPTGETQYITANIDLFATEDVNINAGIQLGAIGSLNIEAKNVNINPADAANVDPVNFTLYTPPPPPPPPVVVPPVVPVDPTPVVPEATFEELVQEVRPEIVEQVKEKFFEKFSEGAKVAFEQQMNTQELAPKNVNQTAIVAENRTESLQGSKEEVAVAASCVDDVCAVLDAKDNLKTVEKPSLKTRVGFKMQGLADRVVNHKGLVDQVKFEVR